MRLNSIDDTSAAPGRQGRGLRPAPIGNLHTDSLQGLAQYLLARMGVQGAGLWTVWHNDKGDLFMGNADSRGAVVADRYTPDMVVCHYHQGRSMSRRVTLEDVIGDLAFTLASLPHAAVAA